MDTMRILRKVRDGKAYKANSKKKEKASCKAHTRKANIVDADDDNDDDDNVLNSSPQPIRTRQPAKLPPKAADRVIAPLPSRATSMVDSRMRKRKRHNRSDEEDNNVRPSIVVDPVSKPLRHESNTAHVPRVSAEHSSRTSFHHLPRAGPSQHTLHPPRNTTRAPDRGHLHLSPIHEPADAERDNYHDFGRAGQPSNTRSRMVPSYNGASNPPESYRSHRMMSYASQPLRRPPSTRHSQQRHMGAPGSSRLQTRYLPVETDVDEGYERYHTDDIYAENAGYDYEYY